MSLSTLHHTACSRAALHPIKIKSKEERRAKKSLAEQEKQQKEALQKLHDQQRKLSKVVLCFGSVAVWGRGGEAVTTTVHLYTHCHTNTNTNTNTTHISAGTC
jgi:hypothetical protein